MAAAAAEICFVVHISCSDNNPFFPSDSPLSEISENREMLVVKKVDSFGLVLIQVHVRKNFKKYNSLHAHQTIPMTDSMDVGLTHPLDFSTC